MTSGLDRVRGGRRLRTRARLGACDAREPQAECMRCREGMPKARWGKCTRDGHHLGTKYGHGRVFAVDDGPAVDLKRHSLSLLLALDVLCAVAAIPLEGAAALKVEAMRRPLGGFRREVSEAAQKLVERGGLVRPAGVPQSQHQHTTAAHETNGNAPHLSTLPFMNQACRRLRHSSILFSRTTHPLTPARAALTSARALG